jgi:hypothetical protein
MSAIGSRQEESSATVNALFCGVDTEANVQFKGQLAARNAPVTTYEMRGLYGTAVLYLSQHPCECSGVVLLSSSGLLAPEEPLSGCELP